MYRLVVIALALGCGAAQREGRRANYNGDPQVAAILQEQRYLSGDGTFGAAYQQEDGIDFKEESDADGNRKGSYSYVDPNGQRRTVSYTAGKDGFRATGDGIPVPPPAPPQPQPQYQSAPQQQYRSAPTSSGNYNSNEDDGQYRPELYEQANSAPVRNYNAIPPAKPQYQPQNVYTGVQQAQYSGVQQQQPQYQSAPVQQQYQPQQNQPQQYQPQQYQQTTPPPHRFFPPGKFSLNRSPDGFAYTFSKA